MPEPTADDQPEHGAGFLSLDVWSVTPEEAEVTKSLFEQFEKATTPAARAEALQLIRTPRMRSSRSSS
jgi:hypothetical protein